MVMKNWEPLLQDSLCQSRMHVFWWVRKGKGGRRRRRWMETHVLGPALAIERRNGFSCRSLKFSSPNFSP